MMRKSSFFAMPFLTIRVKFESSSAFHQSAAQSTVPLSSAMTPFSWLPVMIDLPKKLSTSMPALCQVEPGGVVAGGRIWIDKADGLALEVVNVLVRAVGLDVDDRVITDRTVIVAGGDKRLGLDAREIRGRVGRGAVIGDLDVAGALTLDDRCIVVRQPQFDRHAELLGQILDKGSVAIADAGGVLGRHDGKGQLRVLALPVGGSGRARGANDSGGGNEQVAAIDHLTLLLD